MSQIMFQTALYASLAVCATGLVWRVSVWFRLRVGPDARDVRPSQRLAAVLRGGAAALAGTQALRLLGVFVLDVLLQRRLFAIAKLRWFGHLIVVAGFTLLLAQHALAAFTAGVLFPDYQPTLAPYMFLRNLFGAMVLIGVALLLFGRRRARTGLAHVRRPADSAYVALLALVLAAGFVLEAHKIASPRAFHRMTQQFIGAGNPDALRPLRALWAAEFGVAFGDPQPAPDADLVEAGRTLHRESCESCHTRPVSAFVSYPLAQALAPVTRFLDDAGADVWLLHLHVFAAFLGLALLPFTRLFHAVAAPLSLLVNGVALQVRTRSTQRFSVEARVSRRALALDACVRCGICDLHCSVAPLARYLGNPGLLPSHKLVATGALSRSRLLRAGRVDATGSGQGLRIAEGAFLCTDCGRCTLNCPVGLDLEDLWEAERGELAAAGLPATAQWVQARTAFAWAESLEAAVAGPQDRSGLDARFAPLAADRRSFSRCVQCQTCTNVCPVVAYSTDPRHGVDLTPQKVMNLLRLGLGELTLGSRMVWNCATCYQCQEHCPEGVRVTDIMCELRALAVQRLGAVRARSRMS